MEGTKWKNKKQSSSNSAHKSSFDFVQVSLSLNTNKNLLSLGSKKRKTSFITKHTENQTYVVHCTVSNEHKFLCKYSYSKSSHTIKSKPFSFREA